MRLPATFTLDRARDRRATVRWCRASAVRHPSARSGFVPGISSAWTWVRFRSATRSGTWFGRPRMPDSTTALPTGSSGRDRDRDGSPDRWAMRDICASIADPRRAISRNSYPSASTSRGPATTSRNRYSGMTCSRSPGRSQRGMMFRRVASPRRWCPNAKRHRSSPSMPRRVGSIRDP